MSGPNDNRSARPVGRPRTVDEKTRLERHRADQQRYRDNQAQETHKYNETMMRLMTALVDSNEKTQNANKNILLCLNTLTNRMGKSSGSLIH